MPTPKGMIPNPDPTSPRKFLRAPKDSESIAESVSTELTAADRSQLSECEAVIAEGLDTFYKVGIALSTIRDKRLYRKDYSTFQDYCKERWSMSKTHANRLVQAGEVIQNLTPNGGQMPESERQTRPLTQLPPEQQSEAWNKAVESAEGQVPTGKQVQAVVSEIAPRRVAPPPIPKERPFPVGSILVADDDVLWKIIGPDPQITGSWRLQRFFTDGNTGDWTGQPAIIKQKCRLATPVEAEWYGVISTMPPAQVPESPPPAARREPLRRAATPPPPTITVNPTIHPTIKPPAESESVAIQCAMDAERQNSQLILRLANLEAERNSLRAKLTDLEEHTDSELNEARLLGVRQADSAWFLQLRSAFTETPGFPASLFLFEVESFDEWIRSIKKLCQAHASLLQRESANESAPMVESENGHLPERTESAAPTNPNPPIELRMVLESIGSGLEYRVMRETGGKFRLAGNGKTYDLTEEQVWKNFRIPQTAGRV